jgi:methylenetetrahydrofolate--tRNA-(uracil-5-)-methyltransferase
MFSSDIVVVGGGLAGCEAAWQLAERGLKVSLVEQKPARMSPAHTTPLLAELVCSNSLRSDDAASPAGLLKAELRRAGSLIIACADATRVPAGEALAVDRHAFSRLVTTRLALHERVRIERRPVEDLPVAEVPTIVAGGPLVGGGLAARIRALCGDRFYFYDAIAPIVDADSIDWQYAFRGSRYDKGKDSGASEGDYVNCPLTKEQYRAFVAELRSGQKVAPHAFEEPRYFEGCLPIEVMADRGDDVLAFGPMKPVGLDTDAYAVVQLRAENKYATSYNLVGFQTRLTYGEQARVFKMIPALANAEFLRFGSIHRNSYIESWRLLGPELELRALPHVRLAGQITGVEGYIESTAMGLLAALFAHGRAVGRPVAAPPPTTGFGALYHHLLRPRQPGEPFAPTNINFGLLPPLEVRAKKRERRGLHAARAASAITPWLETVNTTRHLSNLLGVIAEPALS